MPKTQSNLPFFGEGGGNKLKFQVASNDILLQHAEARIGVPCVFIRPLSLRIRLPLSYSFKNSSSGMTGWEKEGIVCSSQAQWGGYETFHGGLPKEMTFSRHSRSEIFLTVHDGCAHPKLRAHNIGAQHDDPPTFRTHAANKTGLLTGIKVNF